MLTQAVHKHPHTSPLPKGEGVRSSKLYDLDDLAAHLAATRGTKTIVHCHGVFDLLHIGHIKHLEEARGMGDFLIVTITPDQHVNKGPGRPAFAQQLRAEALAALQCVDAVAINRWPMAMQTIGLLRPNLYVKGPDYRQAGDDRTGGITLEEEAIQAVGGQLVTTQDVTFSSSNLINRHLSPLPESTRQYLRDFARRHPIDRVIDVLDSARDLKVVVVGEAIIDHYVYCQALGKSSKEPVLAVQQNSEEKFAGGILAVANHLAAFAGRVELITMTGREPEQLDFIRARLDPKIDATFIQRSDGPTIVKRRYIEGYFFQKLFETYDFNDRPIAGEDEAALAAALEAKLGDADIAVVVDFGHGMITPSAVQLLTQRARLLALNTQSNAGNFGCHTISKYPRADLVCLAENELRLEARDRHGDLRPMLRQVSDRLLCLRVMVTRGSHGCMGLERADGHADPGGVKECSHGWSDAAWGVAEPVERSAVIHSAPAGAAETPDSHAPLSPLRGEVEKGDSSPRVAQRSEQHCSTRGYNLAPLGGEDHDAIVEIPAVADQVKDRMGAGDTFLAVAALALARQAPMEVMGLLGNAAGAQAVATVGHRRFLEKTSLIRHVECLLK
ncbi:MAG: PfkB family carbohydrate kinase [Phycisphaeraceae bacterium]